MTNLRVREIFPTIQGEGRWSGAPSIFVRLQGCDVGCPWCDTKESWDFGAPDILVALPGRVLVDYLVKHYGAKPSIHHIVITGGEPAAYDLVEATTALCTRGFAVSLETSGTYPIRVNDEVWVTVSPKWDMPGGRKVRDDALYRANELKVVVGKAADVDRAMDTWTHGQRANGCQLYLQPLSQSSKATEICVAACLDTGAHLSPQTHKYLGLQ